MRISKRLTRKPVVALAVTVALALAGIGSASASASEWPTWVQGETSMKWSASSITVKKNGGSPVSCTWPKTGVSGSRPWGGAWNYTEGGEAIFAEGKVANNFGAWVGLQCEGKTTFEFCACISALDEQENGSFLMGMLPEPTTYASPYGTYFGDEGTEEGVFLNGSGGGSSTLTFTDAPVGHLGSPSVPVTLSGTFTVTTSTGGALTLAEE